MQQALGPEWPAAVEQIGTMLILLLLFFAAIFIMIGRRRSGPMHLIRSVLGLGGFFWAIQLFRGSALSTEEVQKIVDFIQQNQVGPALEQLFSAFNQEEVVFAAAHHSGVCAAPVVAAAQTHADLCTDASAGSCPMIPSR